MVDAILKFFGIPFLAPLTVWFIGGLTFSVAIATGWIADSLMGKNSFGIFVNAILLVAGSVLTFWVWRNLNLPMQREFVYVFIVAIGFFATCFLLFCCFLKRFL